jgi:hypothetical protein
MTKVANPSFLEKLPNDSVIFTCPHAEIILPEDYFVHNIAEIVGKEVDMFGLFHILVWNTFDIEAEKPKKYFYKFKSRIRSIPSSIEEGRGEDGNKQRTLHFNEGSTFISNINLQPNVDVARQMLDIMTLGYLPNIISYDEIAEYWTNVNLYNGISLDSMSQTSIEMMVASLCRDPKDLSRPFRYKLKEDPKTNLYDWKILNIRRLPRYSNTWASLISGDPRGNIVSVISREREGKGQLESPIEKAILAQ